MRNSAWAFRVGFFVGILGLFGPMVPHEVAVAVAISGLALVVAWALFWPTSATDDERA